MANANTTQTKAQSFVTSDHADVARRATWEIEGLVQYVHDQLPIDAESMPLRSTLRRVRRLNGLILSAVDEPHLDASDLLYELDEG